MSANVIETDRLILRPPELEDFDRWAEMMAHEPTARFIGGVQARPMAWRGLMTMAGCWTLTGVAMFSVIEKATGQWIGRLGPWTPEGWPGTEVGWALHPDAHGKGYAYEGSVAAIDYAFDVLGWTDVIHTIDPDNVPSQKLAARLGSVNQGPTRLPAPFEGVTVDSWGQSRDEWRARRAER